MFGERTRFQRELSDLGILLSDRDTDSGSWLLREAIPDPMKGRRIKRATVKDALGTKILNLLWVEISETNVPAMEKRLKALNDLIDKVPDCNAGVLLERLEPGGDLYADFEYRLKTVTRDRIRERLRKRQRFCPPGDLQTRSNIEIPVEDPDGTFPTPIPPQPDPTPVKIPSLPVQLVQEWKFKWLKREGPKITKYFRVIGWIEGKCTAAYTGSDKSLLAIKSKWSKDGYKKEVETRLKHANVKFEFDKKLEKVTVEHKWSGGPLKFNFAVSTDPKELLKFETALPKFNLVSHKILGQDVYVRVELKLVIALKWDWSQLLKDLTKKFFQDLLSRLVGWLAKRYAGALFLALGAGLLAWLLKGGSAGPPGSVPVQPGAPHKPDKPYNPPAGDAVGADTAAEIAQGQVGSAELISAVDEAAANVRRAYAKASGAALERLMSSQNAQVLADFVDRPLPTHDWRESPPKIGDATSAWQIWAQTRSTRGADEKVQLASDNFRLRLRTNEKAVVVARTLNMRHLIGDASYKTVLGIAEQQASAAGFAAAVQYVQTFVLTENYEYLNASGVLVKQDGLKVWTNLGSAIGHLGIGRAPLIDQVGIYMLYRLGALARS